MDLCGTCSIFNIHKPEDTSGYTRRLLFQHVKISAESGCKFCTLVCTEVWSRYPGLQLNLGLQNLFIYYEMIPQDITGLSQSNRDDMGYQYSLMGVRLRHLKCKWESDVIVFSLLADADSQAATSGDIAVAYVENDSKSTKHFNLLRKWLFNCQQSHPYCNHILGSSFTAYEHCAVPLPTRLIDVGESSAPTVKLRNTAGGKGIYMTLSHCWGTDPNHPIPRTTNDNLKQQLGEIQISSLPRTFQDAITIARHLEIRYVWVDSLCIIQDNSDDWRYEASQMARTYQYSALTVAATGAEDSNQGCFLPRRTDPTLETSLVRLPYYARSGGQNGHFFVCHRKQPIHEEILDMLEEGPLLKRGWVFQERLLSRRIVHYTRSKMIFECQSHSPITECNEAYVEVSSSTSLAKLKKEHDLEVFAKLNTKRSLSYFRTRRNYDWYAIVEQYSRLALTRACEDKLVAISGIARELQIQQSSGKANQFPRFWDYVSGFWLHDIILRLSWQAVRLEQVSHAGNYGPSWSWASLDCPIFWPHLLFGGKEDSNFRGKKRTVKCDILDPQPATRPATSSRNFTGLSLDTLVSASTRTSSLVKLPSEITEPQTMEFITTLKIFGRVRPVWRRETPLNVVEQSDFEDACSFPRKGWLEGCHGIYDDAIGPDIIGWGSFESDTLGKSKDIISPAVSQSSSQLETTDISCLLLSSYQVDSGWEYGYLGSTHKVYDVLYLTLVDGENIYRRVGAGRIVEKRFFKNINNTVITLI